MIIRKKCRICNSNIRIIIKFKKIALVGEFYSIKKNLKKFPITLCYCKNCKHIQILEIINPKKLFDNYLWETGISKSNYNLFSSLVSDLKSKIKKSDKIFEIASNDGSFLNYLKKKYGCTLVGIDPAKNLKNKDKSIKIIKNYFDKKISKKIKKKLGTFDFIFARNVLAHVTNPNEIFKGIFEILKFNGKAIIEVPHLLPIIRYNQYDNIFHEHQGFHSLKSIEDLCIRNNLNLIDVKIVDSQGGSIRCLISKKNKLIKSKKIIKILNLEKKFKLFNDKNLLNYKFKILNHQKLLISLLKNLKKKNKVIYAYGASGKGQALMQFCGIDRSIINNVFDKSNLKKNKYTPGTNIKILKPNNIEHKNIDYILLLSWNLKKEILKQERKFIKKGGKFIIPFSKPRIIN